MQNIPFLDYGMEIPSIVCDSYNSDVFPLSAPPFIVNYSPPAPSA